LYRFIEITASIAGNVPGISMNPFFVLVISLVISFLFIVFGYKRKAALLEPEPFL
jgi:hypothetical protein